MADERPQTPVSVRGPLKYQIETSTPQIEAGRRFSVSVRIANPYDVPVTVKSVITKLPAKFLSAENGSWKTALKESLKEVVEAKSLRPLRAKEGGEVVEAQSTAGENEPNVVLQPGNSTVRLFTIRTSSGTFFAPALYNLNIEIEYNIDNNANHDTVGYQMNVRAPLQAIIYGSIVGSVMGYIVRDNLAHDTLQKLVSDHSKQAVASFVIPLLIYVLVGSIVVVAFARKKDTQPILSIEDFWGGMFVGFLAGYGGENFLSQFMGAAGKPAA